MDKQKPIESVSILPRSIVTNTRASSDVTSPRRRIIQNIRLIWMDPEIDESDKDCQNILAQLESVVYDVHIFTQRDECVDFLTNVNDIKVVLIIAPTIGQQILPLIHDILQLDRVYIFGSNKSRSEQWAKTWAKVKGIHTEITSICESLQQAVKQINQDSIAMSFVTLEEGTSTQNLDQLEPSFMYTKLFKEMLLKIEYNPQSIKTFTGYCRNGDYGSPTNITRFESDYYAKSAIWWYTFPSFIYSMLNDALRMLEADTIINMGFFIRDLHHQIKQLHQRQVSNYLGKSFIVYRGQGLNTTDFEKLHKTKGGLISFNNFLSTSSNEQVSLVFANSAITTDMVGILFRMSIDPSVSSAPFASIDEVSYYQTEEEILFSMHTVFRIGDIKQIDKNNPLYQVELTLTSDDDPELRILTDRIREEARGGTEWEGIGTLLVKISHFDKAEELYTALLKQTSDESDKALYHSQLGYVKHGKGDYKEALRCFEKAFEIYQKKHPPNYHALATTYYNIGRVYDSIGEYSKARSFYEKGLEICQKSLPPNHHLLAQFYNNIGEMYMNIGEYSKARSFYEKGLEICQKTLPPNHHSLATSYHNIGLMHRRMGEYSNARSFYEKSLEICQKTLPPNHPDLAASYNSIGAMYREMGEFSKALSVYEKAFEILQKTLPPNLSHLGSSCNNIGMVHDDMGDYSKALSYLQLALEILQRSLPPNHPTVQGTRKNIECVKKKL